MIASFAPYHYLINLFLMAPLHVIGQYLMALAYVAIEADQGHEKKEVLFSDIVNRHFHYAVLVAYAIYRQQRSITELTIKNKLVYQQQDDVQRIISSSVNGLLVFGQESIDPEENDEGCVNHNVLFKNSALAEITGTDFDTVDKDKTNWMECIIEKRFTRARRFEAQFTGSMS